MCGVGFLSCHHTIIVVSVTAGSFVVSGGIVVIGGIVVGGGIVGLPYAFLYLGIPLGIALNILIIVATNLTLIVYLALKDAVPG